MSASVFRNKFSEDIFNYKYRHEGCETWEKLAKVLVEDVCREWMTADEKATLTQAIAEMKFLPGGRYIYYAGRPIKAFNNCYLLRAEEDTREDWAMLSWKAESCLATGGTGPCCPGRQSRAWQLVAALGWTIPFTAPRAHL